MTELGTVLDGKYEILKKVGQGGMSIVYLAMDNRLNKQWAVKEIKNDGSKSVETLLKGLEREANILKNVDHPVLPRIVDIINENGTIYVIMDFVEGKPLNEVLKAEGAQKQSDVIEWGRALASALDYLHSMNPPIIYRDMKPSNVMLKPDGSVKLIDFGTATTYDLVTGDGSFSVGITAPGIRISAKALWEDTAKLPEIEIKKPKSILAQETISSMQAGLVYGQIGQTEYIIRQVRKESGYDNMKVVATGGLGRIIADETDEIQIYDRDLTLEGLRIIYEKNTDRRGNSSK